MHKYCFILQLCYLFFENLLNDKDSEIRSPYVTMFDFGFTCMSLCC